MRQTRFTHLLPLALTLTGLASAQEPFAPVAPASSGHGDPFLPVGSIKVTPTVVREGVQPDMNWAIEYPKTIGDLFLITESGTLISNNAESDKLGVRIVGASHGAEGEELPLAFWTRVGGVGAGWQLLFYGTKAEIDPSAFVYKETISQGTVIDFAARAKEASGGWLSYHWTLRAMPTVETLLSGDPLPAGLAAASNGELESYMTQFLADDGTVSLGPKEVLYLFELDPSSVVGGSGDLQDLAIVVSYAKNNNGHGNNLDEVDGIKKDGTLHDNKGLDPSAGIDDEGKILPL